MNGFDVVLIVLLGLLVLLGILKGLARILIGLVALVAAFMLAAQFHAEFAGTLRSIVEMPEAAALLAAYLLIFVGTMIAGSVAAYLARKLLKAAMLGWVDRLAGAMVGCVAALLVAGLLILPLVAYSPVGERTLRTSVLAPYVTVVADLANRLVPEQMSERYRERVDGLRRYWRERWAAEEA